MPDIIPFEVVAMVSIDASNVATSPIVQGCTITDSGAGLFDLTLSDGGVDATQCVCIGTIRNGGEGNIDIIHTSDTVKRVSVLNAAGAAADIDCDVIIFRTRRM